MADTESIITWNMINWITVISMVVIGFLTIWIGIGIYKKIVGDTGGKNDS